MIPVRSLRDLLALAYLDGLDRKARERAAQRLAAAAGQQVPGVPPAGPHDGRG
jgi:hypothetical protein